MERHLFRAVGKPFPHIYTCTPEAERSNVASQGLGFNSPAGLLVSMMQDCKAGNSNTHRHAKCDFRLHILLNGNNAISFPQDQTASIEI